jgi:hypothetical protein
MSKPAVTLKLDGKPLNLHPASPTVKVMKDFLDKSPKDEIYSPAELSRKIGVHVCSIRHSALHPELSKHTATHLRMRYFGHPAAITALNGQLEAIQ